MSKNIVTVVLTPVKGKPVTEKVEVPPDGSTIAQIMEKLGRDPGRLNFTVAFAADPRTQVAPGSMISATERAAQPSTDTKSAAGHPSDGPSPATTEQVVRPGDTVKAAERPSGS